MYRLLIHDEKCTHFIENNINITIKKLKNKNNYLLLFCTSVVMVKHSGKMNTLIG